MKSDRCAFCEDRLTESMKFFLGDGSWICCDCYEFMKSESLKGALV